MSKKKTETLEISEIKIRQARWYLKRNYTKKYICEFLQIPYNTVRLEKILKEFSEKEFRKQELKEKMKTVVLSLTAQEQIVKDYIAGKAASVLAEEYYISPERVKRVLISKNVPIRGRGKKNPPKVDHIIIDINKSFQIGEEVYLVRKRPYYISGEEKAFSASGKVKIIKKYDEEFCDTWDEGIMAEELRWEPHIDINSVSFKKNWPEGPVEGQHYKIFYQNIYGEWMDRLQLQDIYHANLNIIAKYGQEGYQVYLIPQKDSKGLGPGGYYFALREELYSIQEPK